MTGPPASIEDEGTFFSTWVALFGTASPRVWFGCGYKGRSRMRRIGQPSS
jgi:hypothetical protein